MKQIVMVGAGGMARELLALMTPQIRSGDIVVRGVVDDTREPCDEVFPGYPYPVLGGVAAYVPQADDEVIIAIGEGADGPGDGAFGVGRHDEKLLLQLAEFLFEVD